MFNKWSATAVIAGALSLVGLLGVTPPGIAQKKVNTARPVFIGEDTPRKKSVTPPARAPKRARPVFIGEDNQLTKPVKLRPAAPAKGTHASRFIAEAPESPATPKSHAAPTKTKHAAEFIGEDHHVATHAATVKVKKTSGKKSSRFIGE